MGQATDNSQRGEEAVGICDECGAIVHFAANEWVARCSRCLQQPTRNSSGAVGASYQRAGYRIGTGVTPRCPR